MFSCSRSNYDNICSLISNYMYFSFHFSGRERWSGDARKGWEYFHEGIFILPFIFKKKKSKFDEILYNFMCNKSLLWKHCQLGFVCFPYGLVKYMLKYSCRLDWPAFIFVRSNVIIIIFLIIMKSPLSPKLSHRGVNWKLRTNSIWFMIV